jgi:predicted ATPase with chaperone activity
MSWEEVRSRLTAARTAQERRAAAAALMQHIPEEHLDKHLVYMHKDGSAHAILLSELHLAMEGDQNYELIRKIITGR